MTRTPADAGRDAADTRSNLVADRGNRTRDPANNRTTPGAKAIRLAPGCDESDPTPPIHAASLQAVLDRMDAGNPILSVRSEAYPYGSSHPLEAIDVVFADGSTLALLNKMTAGPNSHSAIATPDFIRDPDREAAAFKLIPRLHDDGAPCLHAVITGDDGESSLLFERINGLELYQHGGIDTWMAAAEWLAVFHARHAIRLPAGSDRLLARNRAHMEQWWQRAIDFARSRDRDPLDGVRLQRIEPRWRRALERLDASPPTIVHGEFYPSNIMIEESATGQRIRPVDWEMAGTASGLLDLAALTGGSWDANRRDSVVNTYRVAYRSAVRAFGSNIRLPQDFERALDDCRLALAVQWLGWSADWTPPAEHRFDWLTEAEAIAGRAEQAELHRVTLAL